MVIPIWCIYQGTYYITDCEWQWFITRHISVLKHCHLVNRLTGLAPLKWPWNLWSLTIPITGENVKYLSWTTPIKSQYNEVGQKIALIDASLFYICNNFTIFFCHLDYICLHNSISQLSFIVVMSLGYFSRDHSMHRVILLTYITIILSFFVLCFRLYFVRNDKNGVSQSYSCDNTFGPNQLLSTKAIY